MSCQPHSTRSVQIEIASLYPNYDVHQITWFHSSRSLVTRVYGPRSRPEVDYRWRIDVETEPASKTMGYFTISSQSQAISLWFEAIKVNLDNHSIMANALNFMDLSPSRENPPASACSMSELPPEVNKNNTIKNSCLITAYYVNVLTFETFVLRVSLPSVHVLCRLKLCYHYHCKLNVSN